MLQTKAVSLTEFEVARVGAKLRFNVAAGRPATLTMSQGGREVEAVRKD